MSTVDQKPKRRCQGDTAIPSMHVAHTVASISDAFGGPSRTIPALCTSLTSASDQVSISLLADSSENKTCPIDDVSHLGVADRSYGAFSRVMSELHREHPMSIIHDHGQWLPVNRAAAAVSKRLRIPRVVSPRGMLTPWARAHNPCRKMLAWWMFARRHLMRADLVHATSELEAEGLSKLGLTCPVVVIPNGVDVPEALPERDDQIRPYVLFMARIHRVKGVDDLLDAWQAIRADGMELVLAGPDEEGLIESSLLPDGVRYLGAVNDHEKWALLRNASLFVLPSYSENFGVAVAESLAVETPVIATTGTPWRSLQTEDCGWWVTPGRDSLKRALEVALDHTDDERWAMGRAGRTYVKNSFAWGSIATQMLDAYSWVLNGGMPPRTIR